jgi:hypothetical protein
MEMKIKNGAFYVMEAGEEKAIYDSIPNAIDALKTIVGQKSDLDSKKVNIYMVNIAKEKWEIVTIPWAEIAMELLKKK